MGKASYIMQREDLKQALKTIDQLRAREQELLAERESYQSTIDMLEARAARLEDLFKEGFDSGDDHDLDEWEQRAKRILNENPRQSAAEIQAETLDNLIDDIDFDDNGRHVINIIKRQIDRIREQDNG